MDIRLRGCLGRFEELLRNRPAIQLLGIETTSIVGDRDDHVAALVIGADRQAPLSGFAVALSCLGIFDGVVDTVSQHMHQRIADFIDDVAIELCVLARHDQLEGLA